MNFSDRDLAAFRKEVQRVRKHEESGRAKKADGEPVAAAAISPEDDLPRGQSLSVLPRLRGLLEALLGPPEPSHESLQAIPEHVVTLLQVIGEQPKFEGWLFAIEALPLTHRNQQLEKMSFAFRIENGTSTIAEAFDALQNPILFKAFCRVLRGEVQT